MAGTPTLFISSTLCGWSGSAFSCSSPCSSCQRHASTRPSGVPGPTALGLAKRQAGRRAGGCGHSSGIFFRNSAPRGSAAAAPPTVLRSSGGISPSPDSNYVHISIAAPPDSLSPAGNAGRLSRLGGSPLDNTDSSPFGVRLTTRSGHGTPAWCLSPYPILRALTPRSIRSQLPPPLFHSPIDIREDRFLTSNSHSRRVCLPAILSRYNTLFCPYTAEECPLTPLPPPSPSAHPPPWAAAGCQTTPPTVARKLKYRNLCDSR